MSEIGLPAPDTSGMGPRLGDPAIPFRLRTTLGERSLADYGGRWLVLFSHPADFTPVCTSEFIALARSYEDFQAMDCDLLGLSVDSLYAHLAWVRGIRQDFGVEIPFALGEDLSMSVARAYGMIHPGDTDTATVRATFLIDPAGIVRLISYYPMSTGRDVSELLRALAALRLTDASGVATPAGWRPGEPGLLAPPVTVEEADARVEEEATSWYYASKPAGP